MRSNKRVMLCLCLIVTPIGLLSSTTHARGLPASEGIVNFAKVSETLYRGAQPDEIALQNLKRLGVKSIINLRMPGDSWTDEESKASAHGILYTNVPFRGMSRPTDEQVSIVLSLIDSLPGPVFIHCRHGCDRTGTIIACYRIKHDQWSLQKAMIEANKHGISIFERGMKRFITDFAKLSAKAQDLAKSAARPVP